VIVLPMNVTSPTLGNEAFEDWGAVGAGRASIPVPHPTSAMQPAGQDPEGASRPEWSQYRSVRGRMPVLSG